ncbi:TPA: hypothetical protein ACP41M_001095 [Klebsiella aerogenes]
MTFETSSRRTLLRLVIVLDIALWLAIVLVAWVVYLLVEWWMK